MLRSIAGALLPLALGAGGLRADPAFNPSVALQTIGGADMTKPASRDNPLPVWLPFSAASPLYVAVVSLPYSTVAPLAVSVVGEPWTSASPMPVAVQGQPTTVLAPVNTAPGLVAIAVGTASKEVLPAGGPWRWRFVQNTDANSGAWCAFGVPAVKAAPAIFLLPREKLTLDAAAFIPAGALNCISDAIAGTIAVTAGQVAR